MFLGPVDDDPQAIEVKRLRVRPGDRIVVRLDHEPSEWEFESLARELRQGFEGLNYTPPVIVLSPGMEIGVIGPDEAPHPDGIIRQAALEALLSTGFDPFNARAVLGMGPEAGGT